MNVFKLLAVLPVILIEIVFACLEIVTSLISGALTLTRVRMFKEYDYRTWLKRDLADCDSILELGCGSNSPLLQIGDSHRTDAIDIWQPYIDMHNRLGNYRNCQQTDVFEYKFSEKSYDAVVICDVLEHLPKEKVYEANLFALLEKTACKKVILFTPNGFVENDEVDGDPYQRHLSAWFPQDYIAKGYKVYGATGLRWLFGKASLPKYRPHCVCAIIGMMTKPLVFHKPKLAWHSYAVKELS